MWNKIMFIVFQAADKYPDFCINGRHVCCCIYFVDILRFEAQAAAKDYSSMIGLLIAFFLPFFSFCYFIYIYISFAQRHSKDLLFFYFCMAKGSRGNPLERLLLCCTAPTTIQIGSWLEAMCMLLKGYFLPVCQMFDASFMFDARAVLMRLGDS